MKKRIALIVAAVLLLGVLSGCCLSHEWVEADCVNPKTCAKCGVVEGEELGHDYQDANCESPKTCSRCGKEKGDALGHTWTDATCAAPKTCSVCGTTEGEALPHNWNDADCENPKTCADCGATEGEAAGHKWLSSSECNTEIFCTDCGASNGFTPDHVWVEADCVNPKTCSTCGATEGEALGHLWVDATYEHPKTCAVCRATEGEPLQQEPEAPVHLGSTYDVFATTIDAVLQQNGYYLEYLGVDDEGDLVYEVIRSSTNTSVELYLYLVLYEDTDYVYGFMSFTEKGKEEGVANVTGICFGAAWAVSDSSFTNADLTALMGNYEVDEYGDTYFTYQKNGLEYVMAISADETQIMTIVAPIE